MKRTTFFITGTDTGVGKTVLTAWLTRYLRERGVPAAALKPVCSGGRDDARRLCAASAGALALDEVNPWHFRAPLAPLLAARRERKPVKLSQVLAYIRMMHRRFAVLLVEGAGGLLSPLGENFDSRELIASLHAIPIIVCPNRLGMVNQARLTVEALPTGAAARARIVMVSPPAPDAITRTNAGLLAEHFDGKRIFPMPWLSEPFDLKSTAKDPRVKRMLRALTQFTF